MAPLVIKVAGKARRANLNGQTIFRSEVIYVPSEHAAFRIIDTWDHFCYRQNQFLGPTLMCTCGSTAGIYNFDAYMQFQSTNMGRIICCQSLVENRHHADGTTG